MTKSRILLTTQIPSPYQVELFDRLSATGEIELRVFYERLGQQGRLWRVKDLRHKFDVVGCLQASQITQVVREFDVIIFSGYRCPKVRLLIQEAERQGKRWCFWGERTGFHLPAWLGRHYRDVVFPQLRRSPVPIWAIGNWAVESYRSEYGSNRHILNMPYTSDLQRFFQAERQGLCRQAKRILFSGSLIKRKGVDLLLKAFLEICADFPEAELHLIGDGPLRSEIESLARFKEGRIVLHGFKQWGELPQYYAEADILCAPSRYDGWGLIVPEGLASGLLVISTDRTGSALEMLTSDVGWRVRANDLDDLKLALRSALSAPPEERAARIRRGRELVKSYDVESGVQRFLSALSDLISVQSVNDAVLNP